MKLIYKRFKTLICALGLLCLGQVWASDWVSVGMSDRAVYGFDHSSPGLTSAATC